MHVVEVLFFTGLIGCGVVVLLSWILILKSVLSHKDEF